MTDPVESETGRRIARQVLACLKCCLDFEEPESKWQRLLKLAHRFAAGRNMKARQVEKMSLPDQQKLFRAAFATVDSESRRLNTIFNIILAVRDLRQFTPLAFQAWHSSYGRAGEKMHDIFVPDIEEQVTILSDRLSFTGAQKEWLLNAAAAVPNWSVLLEKDCPWRGGGVHALIVSLFQQIGEIDAQAVHDARYFEQLADAFVQLVHHRRGSLPATFFPRLLLLVEGPTEAILLPHFARVLGTDLEARGILTISAGGANQTTRKFFILRDLTTVPIFLVLDADASEQLKLIREMLRGNDRLYAWSAGEIEDIIDSAVLIEQINYFLAEHGHFDPVGQQDVERCARRTRSLDRIFKERGLGGFDKTGFARSLAEKLQTPAQVPAEATFLIRQICRMASG